MLYSSGNTSIYLSIYLFIYLSIYMYIYIYIYIVVLKGFKAQNSKNLGTFQRSDWNKCSFLLAFCFFLFLTKKDIVAINWFQLKTLHIIYIYIKGTPVEIKLISVEILTVHLDLKGKTIESKLISIEILADPFVLKGKSIDCKLISIEIRSSHLDLQGKSIESKSISIELLTYPLDLQETSHKFLMFGFAAHVWGENLHIKNQTWHESSFIELNSHVWWLS